MRRWRFALLAAVTGLAGADCRRPASPALPRTPEQALAALARAGDDGAALFDLLDQQSRWSVMSVHRDLRKVCELVRQSYPKDRQAREITRCRAAETADDARAFFAGQARGWGLLATLEGLSGTESLPGSGDRRTAQGKHGPVSLCQDGEGWGYCGAREALEAMKVKTARDLATVQENAEAFRGR